MIAFKKSPIGRKSVNLLIERQTYALEEIAARLAGIERKLDRVASALEREVNPSTHPF